MDDLREEQRLWLRNVLATTGLSAKALAERAKVSPPTLTAFLTSKKATHNLSARTIAGIEKATGMAYGPDPKLSALRESESEPYKYDKSPEELSFLKTAFGPANGIDPWRLKSRALETAGYLPGDILIVDLNREHLPGDVVCAQLYDWPRSKAETVFRLWEPPCLLSATYDNSLRKPYIVDNENVVIKGVVITSIRARHARAA